MEITPSLPRVGSLLVSNKMLTSSRKVIMIVDTDPDCITGLLLNKHLGKICSYEGLPIEDPRDGGDYAVGNDKPTILHTFDINQSFEVAKGIFLNGSPRSLKKILEKNPSSIMKMVFCYGHTVWKLKELSDEMRKGIWISYSSIKTKNIIFYNNYEDMWETAMRDVEDDYMLNLSTDMTVHIQ